MPGIPRSKGCQRCVQRRVKCDETRPNCRECARRNFICPGYPETFTFYNVHTWSSQQPHRSNRGVRTYAAGSPDTPHTSIDAQRMPSLAAHATHTQECSVFSHYVGANFSGLWACYARRMDLNWLDFILRPAQPHPHFLQSAVRTLSILHLSQTENPSLITQSMSAYGETLASLRRAAGRLPFSDEMFAATILVALYEMKNMSFQASWVTTTNSIANVMQSTNNPSRTYASGFGRTLFLTIRPFLIRTALSRGQACFLERAEWISVVETMVHSENHNSRGSLFGATIEKAFIEIVKIPGLAARTYALHAASEDSVLTASTIQCQSRLVDIERDMRNTSLAERYCSSNRHIASRDSITWALLLLPNVG